VQPRCHASLAGDYIPPSSTTAQLPDWQTARLLRQGSITHDDTFEHFGCASFFPAGRQEHVPHVFDSERQSASALHAMPEPGELGGLGLGLNLCRQLVEIHGGVIGVHSDGLGHGAVFSVRLPETAVIAPPAVVPIPVKSARKGLARRVLLVDDNLMNQVYGEALIETLGFRVAIASDGVDAVQRWKTEPFDLILMDCHMPVMDGFAAARRIRQSELGRGTHTPIVALTGCTDDDEHEGIVQQPGIPQIIDQPAHLVVRIGEITRIHFHKPYIQLFLLSSQRIPCRYTRIAGRQLSIRRNDAQSSLIGDHLIPEGIPSIIEFPFILVAPVFVDLVWRMGGAGCII